MRKTLITLLLIAACFGQAGAQRIINTLQNGAALRLAPRRVLSATEYGLGYTMEDSISASNVSVGKEGTVPVAALVGPSQLAAYKGCKIVGIRFALGTSIGSTQAFIYKIENNTVADTIRENRVRRTSDGWNELRFNAAQEYTIDGTETLLFGFNDVETASMVSSGEGPLAVFKPTTSNSNAFLAYGDFGSGEGFYSLADKGNLCVQLIVDVSSLPQKDIHMSAITIGTRYKKPGESIDAFALYTNSGLSDISSCRFSCQIDDLPAEPINTNETVKTGAEGSVEKVFAIPSSLKEGRHNLRFFVDSIDGEAPTSCDDDTLTATFILYNGSLKRQQHYVEQYYSQNSYLQSLVDEEMDKTDADANICLVNIPQAGTSLAVAATQYLEPLYAYTYPCFTIDRFYFFGESHIAFDANQYAQIMPSIVSESVRMLVSEADANPAFATVNIEQPSYSADTRTLSVNISGEVYEPALSDDFLGSMSLTVLLAEDSVTAPQAVLNATGDNVVIDNDYVHNEVFRTYLSAPLGDVIQCEDGTYKASYTTTLPKDWNVNHLKLVAFVAPAADKVDESNVLDMDITNANSYRLSGLVTDRIGSVSTADESEQTIYYNLQGEKMTQEHLNPGVYLLKKGNKVRKVLVR